MDKILEARNLKISFRTDAGKVQAVRDISFDLLRGETLAIVGESGSGKSVTARSMLGILAPNAIVERGELIYDGQDLLKITEDDFHQIRGEKISMIFQDPLSALNPIVRIGKQLTEAMVIKGKVKQRNARKAFNRKLAQINELMDLVTNADNNPELKAQNRARVENFDKFEYKHTELENAYNKAKEAALEAIDEIDQLLFEHSKNVHKNFNHRLTSVVRFCRAAVNRYVVHEDAQRLYELTSSINNLYLNGDTVFAHVIGGFKNILGELGLKKQIDYSGIDTILEELKTILKRTDSFVQPNFFAMGYYLTFASEPLPEMETVELNKFLRKYLDDNFMLDFIVATKDAVQFSFDRSVENKRKLLDALNANRSFFDVNGMLDKDKSFEICEKLSKIVSESIDRLKIYKDSTAYTFGTALRDLLKKYFGAVRKNQKEQERFDSETSRYNARVAKGKVLDWKVVPAALVDIESVKNNILRLIDRLISSTQQQIDDAPAFDCGAATIEIVDYLKATASDVVHRVTKRLAKIRAIKLMEEVGIPEPRLRYRQFPFQFSGGMRQRIVIAIALAADPEILVCDEPTTALDVTIQAQILELINKLKVERGLSVIFITHDLGVVANMADRIAVMYAGKIVEYGTAEEVFYSPAHPYTWALLSSMPDLDTTEKLEAIPGTPPNMIFPPKGDAFAARNKYAMKIDFEQQPPMFEITPTHSAATWLLHPNAPKIELPKIVVERIERMRLYTAAEANAQADAETAAVSYDANVAAEKTEDNPSVNDDIIADSKPATTKSATTRSATARSATAKSATAKPATAKSATAKPATAKSATAKPATAKPATAKSATTKSATAKSATAKSATAKPATAKSATAKPATTKPATTKPATAKPATAKPATAKPAAVKKSDNAPKGGKA